MSSEADPFTELKQEDYLKLFVSWFRLSTHDECFQGYDFKHNVYCIYLHNVW